MFVGVDNMKRVIFVEPVIEKGDLIETIFRKYNPDSDFVNLHICLVFPFESDLSVEEIDNIFNNVLPKYNDFNICLSGLSISYEEKNNFLFLNVIDENDVLKNISKELYEYLGTNASLKGTYTPHITIGKSKNIEEIESIYKTVSNLLIGSFNAQIHSINSKILVKDVDGNVSLEKEIEYDLTQKRNKTI